MAKINRSQIVRNAFSNFYHFIKEAKRRADFGKRTPNSPRIRSKLEADIFDIIVTAVVSTGFLVYDLSRPIFPSKYDYIR